jgi:putative adenylate-forming enzyme
MNILIMLRLLHQLEQLRRHERWTRPQLEAYQVEALSRLREYAYTRSPFYRQFHAGQTDRPLHELPVLTKVTMMEQFDELVTDRAVHLEDVRAHIHRDTEGRRFLGRYRVNATSGSSGQPGLFLFDPAEWLAILASFARAHEWAGAKVSLTHRMKMASVASISPWHMSAQVGAAVKSWWMPALRLAATEPLPEIVRQLNDWQPEMLVAYASMLRILANEQLAGRLRIHPYLIFVSSEVLTEETRQLVKAAWDHAPFNEYATTETGGLAAEYGSGGQMVLFEDLAIVEIVDELNRPVPPGVYGDKVLVTTLFSRTQPLIRYQLNDRVRLAAGPTPLTLPFARIDDIQGRVEDILYLPGVAGREVAIHPLAFHQILDPLLVTGWQVHQEVDGLNVLLSGTTNGTTEQRLVDSLSQVLAVKGVIVPAIRVQRVSAIPKTTAGKAPLIRSNHEGQK